MDTALSVFVIPWRRSRLGRRVGRLRLNLTLILPMMADGMDCFSCPNFSPDGGTTVVVLLELAGKSTPSSLCDDERRLLSADEALHSYDPWMCVLFFIFVLCCSSVNTISDAYIRQRF
jgi:hypothetical protein